MEKLFEVWGLFMKFEVFEEDEGWIEFDMLRVFLVDSELLLCVGLLKEVWCCLGRENF